MRYRSVTRFILDGAGNKVGVESVDVPFTAEEEAEHDALAAVSGSLAYKQAELKRLVTEKRDQVQFGGADVGGMRIKTDPGSIALLDQALMLSQRKPNRKFKVKNEAGVHVEMNAAQIGNIFDLLGERVALCWDAEAAHYAAIDALPDIAAAQSYDINTGWPA